MLDGHWLQERRPLFNFPTQTVVTKTSETLTETNMASPDRPITALDILPRTVLVHPGFVFAGHLDVPRLRESAAKVLDVYPELNVAIEADWFKVSPALLSYLFSRPLLSSDLPVLQHQLTLVFFSQAWSMAHAGSERPRLGLQASRLARQDLS